MIRPQKYLCLTVALQFVNFIFKIMHQQFVNFTDFLNIVTSLAITALDVAIGTKEFVNLFFKIMVQVEQWQQV